MNNFSADDQVEWQQPQGGDGYGDRGSGVGGACQWWRRPRRLLPSVSSCMHHNNKTHRRTQSDRDRKILLDGQGQPRGMRRSGVGGGKVGG